MIVIVHHKDGRIEVYSKDDLIVTVIEWDIGGVHRKRLVGPEGEEAFVYGLDSEDFDRLRGPDRRAFELSRM